jgi:hypothetical protein
MAATARSGLAIAMAATHIHPRDEAAHPALCGFFLEKIMQFEGAVIREQSVTFAIVVVKQHILNSASEAANAVRNFRPAFPGLPIILMGQDNRGLPTYYGRRDIVDFLANISISRIPWQRYSFT